MAPKPKIALLFAAALALGANAAQAQSSGTGGTSTGTSSGTSTGTSTGTLTAPPATTTPGVINPATGLPNPPLGTTGSSGRINPRITTTPNNSITSSPGTQVIQPYTSPSGHGSLTNQGTSSGTIGGVPPIDSTVRP